MSGIVAAIAVTAAFTGSVDEQPYRAGIAFFDAVGSLDGTVFSADIRMRANPRASKPAVYVYVRDGERHYEVTTDECPMLGIILADSTSLVPRSIDLPGSASGPKTTRADGITYQLEAPYAQSDGGSGRITLSSNNGALADWGSRLVETVKGCGGRR